MTVGTPPGTGPALVDGTWLNGLAGGTNQTYISGINLASNNQSTGYFLPGQLQLVEIDTVGASGNSLTLPFAQAGTEIAIINNGANPANVFANPNINALTGSTDTINALTNTTALSVTNATITIFYCAKNGHWLTK